MAKQPKEAPMAELLEGVDQLLHRRQFMAVEMLRQRPSKRAQANRFPPRMAD